MASDDRPGSGSGRSSSPSRNAPGANGKERRSGRSRAAGLALLALCIAIPVLWTRLGASAGPVRAYGPGGEDAAERMLLDAALPAALGADAAAPEPPRPCKPPSLHTELPKLVTVQQWLSAKTIPREAITIITQLSADRLTMLENQCRTWPDPIVAAIYVPLVRGRDGGRPAIPTYRNTTLDDVIRGIHSFHAFMEGTAACALRIELLGQYMNPRYPRAYPINALRNKALGLATSELVFLLDVDFAASPRLGLPEPGYRDPAAYGQMVELAGRRRALVLPAFEITNRRQDLTMAQNFARSLVMAGKEEVRRNYRLGFIDAFNGRDAPWGHGPTNTSKWARLARPVLYRVAYEEKYEPFVVLSRRAAPYFDERFVGYGGNKIAYINQLAGAGFGFHVHPFGFAVHVPHARTKAADVFVARKHRGESEMETLRVEVERKVARGTYLPVVAGCSKAASAAAAAALAAAAGAGGDAAAAARRA